MMLAWELLDLGGTDIDIHLAAFVVLILVCMAVIGAVEAWSDKTFRQIVYGVKKAEESDDDV